MEIDISMVALEIRDSAMGGRFRWINRRFQCSSRDGSHALAISKRHSALFGPRLSACNHKTGQVKERVMQCRVLCKPTVANLLHIQRVLNDMERDLVLLDTPSWAAKTHYFPK